MFCCCCRRKKVVISETIVDNNIENKENDVNNNNFENIIQHENTDFLSSEEINKIKNNISKLIIFIDQVEINIKLIIEDVFNMLKLENIDLDKDVSSNILLSSFTSINNIPVESSKFISNFIRSIINLHLDNDILNNKFESLNERYSKIFSLFKETLYDIADDIQLNRNTIYTNNTENITIRDLINNEIFDEESPKFKDCLITQRRSFKYLLCKYLITTNNNIGIYYIGDNNKILSAKKDEGEIIIAKNNSEIFGRGKVILENKYLRELKPEYSEVISYGISDTDLDTSFIEACRYFIEKIPAAVISPYIIKKDEIRFVVYWILQNYKDENNWELADEELLKWLFIDDGIGNTVNIEGVGKKEDIIKNWMVNGNFMIEENDLKHFDTM